MLVMGKSLYLRKIIKQLWGNDMAYKVFENERPIDSYGIGELE